MAADDRGDGDDEDDEARDHETGHLAAGNIVDLDHGHLAPRPVVLIGLGADAEVVVPLDQTRDVGTEVAAAVELDRIIEVAGPGPLEDDDRVGGQIRIGRPDETEVTFGRAGFESGFDETDRRQRLGAGTGGEVQE